MINQVSFLSSAASNSLSPLGEHAPRTRHGGLASERTRGHVRAGARNGGWGERPSGLGKDSTMINQASFLSSAASNSLSPLGERAPRTRHGGLASERTRGHARAGAPSGRRGERTSTSAGTAP